MAQINFRIDDETKHRAEELFASLGLTMSSAITVFIHHSLDYQGLPFEVRKTQSSPYHEKLLQAKRDWDNGRKNYHFHDLIDVDDDKHSSKAKPRRASKNRCRRAVA